MEFLLAIFAIVIFSFLGSIFIRVSWWFLKAIVGFLGFLIILGFIVALL